MYTNFFMGDELSALGFGTMRLPLLEGGEVDIAQTEEMVDYALAHGVNYFDTAWPYHACKSEIVIGNVLKAYPRQQFYLADKYPGHVKAARYDPADLFEKQLRKCGVEYFDYYLLHNVYEGSLDVYTSPEWKIMDYFRRQKAEGRIRHLGMSTHGSPDTVAHILDLFPDIEFVQIQLNYVDWILQNAEKTVNILRERGKAIWVMEPLRGGKLAKWDDASLKMLRERTTLPETELAFRWLQGIPEVKVILSGMSDLEQMKQNVLFFEERKPLSEDLSSFLESYASDIKGLVPCTACRYCCDGCPAGLDIPKLLRSHNDFSFKADITPFMWIEALPAEKKPSACIGCGKCAAICPQKIDIPGVLKRLCTQIASVPTWAEVSRKRNEDTARMDNAMTNS